MDATERQSLTETEREGGKDQRGSSSNRETLVAEAKAGDASRCRHDHRYLYLIRLPGPQCMESG